MLMQSKRKEYAVGLIYGRFQPFHKGHRYLFQKALQSIDKIVIGIGSVNIKDENNPYNFKKRKKMLEEFVYHEKIEGKVLKIVPLDDIPSDDEWLLMTLRQTGKIDVVAGNNEWTNGIFEKAGYPILVIPHYKRYLLEGYKIRKLMKEGKEWKNRVPSYIIPIL